jgi:hypothetical protein
MSMDDVLDQILRFEYALEQFGISLEHAWSDLQQRHEELDPDWQDDLQRRYMQIWIPIYERLSRYRTVELPDGFERIQTKERQAREYLNGSF